jgi:uncharacterized membrane protein
VPLAAAEALWYDTDRWVEWVVGLERVVGVEPGWPARVGATVTWRSNPAGRGTVRERVLEHVAGARQRLAVADDTIEGEQTISFAPADGGVQVSLTLRFRRPAGGLLTALVDVLFSRRAMSDALAHTLERFAAALDARR